MQYYANTPEEYIAQLPEQRKQPVQQLRVIIKENLPEGFEEVIQYAMLGYVVPHSLYPRGYHVTPSEPLPFMGIASQKNHIAVYHMGLSLFPEVLAWFQEEYPKHAAVKLDMGKGCIRFRNEKHIPYELITQLSSKISAEEYIARYEAVIDNRQRGKRG